MTVVAFDADVLGRQRTGDETYALNLLRELGRLAPDAGIRLVAITRHPELVPEGIEPYELRARSQELRMAWTLPRALRSLGAALSHTQHALPVINGRGRSAVDQPLYRIREWRRCRDRSRSRH